MYFFSYFATSLSDRKQSEVLAQFRSGYHNVLVSTCIGEEGEYFCGKNLFLNYFLGLDIGEVDMCICFDAIPSAVRMQQRYV
jgi:ATP-dependent DNA helicase MPH1